MNLGGIFKKRDVWSIAIYRLNLDRDIFKIEKATPIRWFGQRGFRKDRRYQCFNADPFLHVHNNRLYVFYEVKTDFGHGEIWAQSMDLHGRWLNHGLVLREDYHLSYPQVFAHNGQSWMIPESAASGGVYLYEADSFPDRWRKRRTLLDEELVDCSIHFDLNGVYLMGTTRQDELKMYFAENLFSDFTAINFFITKDRSVSRNGGGIVTIDGGLYRVAQNCENAYGSKIVIAKVDEISRCAYREHVLVPDLFNRRSDWMVSGCHHMSKVDFAGCVYVAVDGARKDSYLNTISLIFWKLYDRFIKF